MTPPKAKVYVSYDYENDATLKDFIVDQSKLADSPFEVTGHSTKESADATQTKIETCDGVLIMLGPKTHEAEWVLAELALAKSLAKHVCQVMAYKETNYDSIDAAGWLYRWNWPNLKRVIATWPGQGPAQT